ncbi:MAG: hypothetical protein LBU11_01605 [Zoogloeaceae bacterium]|nr:hypothetical protein [Zoogloeaceae bacterium]
MRKQGKILRDGQNGNGLISSQGEKYEFHIETHWKSDAPPQLGMSVCFEVDDAGALISAVAADEAKQKAAWNDRQKQGKILRDGQNGDGLISSQGEKYAFSLETHWKSDTPPQVGMSVCFEVNDAGAIISVTVVDSMAEAKQKLSEFGEKARTDGLPMLKVMSEFVVARMGWWRIAFFFLLLFMWNGFDCVNHNDFFQSLRAVSHWDDGGSLHYWLAVVSLLLLLLPLAWKHALARLSAVLPVVPMIILWLRVFNITFGFGRSPFRYGFYLTLLVCIVAAVLAVLEYLKSRKRKAAFR